MLLLALAAATIACGSANALSTATPSATPSPTPDPTQIASPTADPTQDPTPDPTQTATAEPTPGGTATPGDDVPDGSVLVFLNDGVFFLPDGLEVVDAHEPFCRYEHVHGPTITSLIPGAGGQHISRDEHLGE